MVAAKDNVAIAIAKDNVAAVAEGDDVAAVAEDDVAVMFVVGVLLLSDRPASLRRSDAPKLGVYCCCCCWRVARRRRRHAEAAPSRKAAPDYSPLHEIWRTDR